MPAQRPFLAVDTCTLAAALAHAILLQEIHSEAWPTLLLSP